HRLTSLRNPRQSASPTPKYVTSEYDDQGRVWRQTDELGRQTLLDYATIPNGTLVTDPAGNQTAFTFVNFACTSITVGYGQPEAATWQFENDPATLRMTKVTDPDNRLVSTA